MQRKIWIILSAVAMIILPTAALSQVANPSIIPVVTAPSGSCPQGLPNQQVISTGVLYSCQNIVSGVGTWGVIPGGSSATASSLSGGFVSGAGQPYNSANNTTNFVYPATNVNALNLDGNRTDSYTPDGTPERPYTTLTQLLAGAASVTGPYVIACNPTAFAYAYTGAVTFPSYQTTIIGNGCTWNITGNVTVPGVYFISNLYTTITGTLSYTASSTSEKVRLGGSLTVSGGITTSGYDHFFDMSILSNTVINIGAGSTPVFTNVVGTPLFKSASGSTAATVLTIIDSQSLATGAYTNVDMSNGGLAVIRGFIATNNNTVANINLAGSSGSSATVASELAGVSAAWAAAGTSYVYIDNGSVYGLLTGSNLLTPNGLGMSAPASNTMTVKSGTTGAATFDSGTTGAVNVGTGASVKTVSIGSTVSGSKVNVSGEIDGAAAGAGYIGQVISSLIASGSAVSLTTNTPANMTSISLTAGDWDVEGSVVFVGGSVTIAAGSLHEVGFSTTTAALPTDGSEMYLDPSALTTTSANFGTPVQRKIYNVSTTTTVYLVAEGTFTAGTEKVYGTITARRVH